MASSTHMALIDEFLSLPPIPMSKGYLLPLLKRFAQPGGRPAGLVGPLGLCPWASSSPPSSSMTAGKVRQFTTVSKVQISRHLAFYQSQFYLLQPLKGLTTSVSWSLAWGRCLTERQRKYRTLSALLSAVTESLSRVVRIYFQRKPID